MVDIATLAIAIDATPVKAGVAELDKLTTAGARAEGAVDRLGDTAQQTGEQMRGAGRGAAEMAAQAQAAARATSAAGASAGQARAGMQQLGYQLGDAATMFSSGASAAQIFGTQLGQTIQAVQLMTGGTSRLAAFLGGPWGIALSVGAIAMAPFIGKLYEIVAGAQTATGALQSLIEKQRQQTAEKFKQVNAEKDLNGLLKRQSELQAEIAQRGVKNSATGQLMFVYKQQKELADISRQIAEGRQAIDNERASAVSLDKIMGDLAAKRLKDAFAIEKQTKVKHEKIKVDKQELFLGNELLQMEFDADRLRAQNNEAILGKQLDRDWQKMWDKRAEQAAKVTAGITATANANAEWNDRLRETINLLDGLGGAGSTLANIGAIFEALGSGEWRNVRGPASIIGSALFTTTDKDGKKVVSELGRKFETVLDKTFGEKGSFSKLLKGAGIGVAVGGIAYGNNAGALTGAGIGGALGEAAFKKLAPKLFKSLGDFAGPIGTILGGIFGGALGSIFSKTTKGYAVVSNTGVSSGGNNGDLQASSRTSGYGIQGAIQTIADQLGGTVGNYSVSIGKRSSGWIRVSASGSSRVGDKNYNKGPDVIYNGKDEAEALRVAILNAIRDGAIQGIRAGTQALLQKEGDIEAQLAKALKFEGVFTSLKAELDPLGAALDDINKRFTSLRAIFTEAGASAAEFAQLEQLLALERAKAAEQAQQAIVDRVRDSWNLEVKLLDLLGKNESALAASRLLELASMKATLQPLQAMIYQLEDAQGIIEKFGPLADDLKKFRAELLGGGDATGSFGFVQAQFRSTAAAAALGDPTALGGLRSAANTYLTSARNNAGSALDYQRALGEVLSAVDRGIFAADTQVDYAQAQIDAINNSANIMERMRSELVTLQGQIAVDSETMRKLLQRFENDGVTISDATAPLQVQVVS